MRTIEFNIAKRRLAKLWFLGAAIIFFALVLQSVGKHYGSHVEDIWVWFLPNFVPSLGLMVGVFAADIQESNGVSRIVDIFYFRLAWWISFAYIATVFVTLIGVNLGDAPAYELLTQSNFWLAPMQSLAGAALGVFFVKSTG